MTNEQPPEESVEQRINKDHSGIFSVSPSSGEFYEREAFLDFYDDLLDFDDDLLDFDPLSYHSLHDVINWDTLGFSDPTSFVERIFGSESPSKRDHDLTLKLMVLLSERNTSAETDRCLALAVQLGMAYQRLLLWPAEEMAKVERKTKKQRKSLSKNRQKITSDKACELCERIQAEAEKELNTRSIAKRASNQYKKECDLDVSSETIRKLWSKHGEAWCERQAREKRIQESRFDFFAELKANRMQPPDSSSKSDEDDVPW